MTFTIKTIGCKVNTYESNKIKDELLKRGLSYIDVSEKDNYDDIDYFIINTCSVTAIADKKSRQMINRARSLNKDIKIIATGCMIENIGEKISGIDYLVKNADKMKIPEMIENFEKVTIHNDIKIKSSIRSFIKIQDGCDEYCTYCIIPYLRGHIKSRNDDEIINEIKEKLSGGAKEIVLTGIHISSFGVDRYNKNYDTSGAIDLARTSLMNLLTKIIDINKASDEERKIKRLRLGSLEPRIINEEFIKYLTMSDIKDIFCPNFCLSLQSGSDKILKLMNRHYTTLDFEKACDIIRTYMQNATITSDIIVGFPGETIKDFDDTVSFVKKMRFYNPNIFPYSKRKGTRAETFDNQLTKEIKHKRAVYLIGVCNEITKEIESIYNKDFHEILIEDVVIEDGKKYGIGYTKEYIRGKIEL